MARTVIGVVMNGVTGRMGYRQHLVRSILALRAEGGLPLPDGRTLWPEPILVGRGEDRLRELAERHGLSRWTTSLEEALADPEAQIYFDAQVTPAREKAVRAAIAAGKHIYTEKPSAHSLTGALELAGLARDAGVCNGVVQDKLFLPGLLKLRRLVDGGFFGRILSVRGEFGYWVFEGDWQDAQRPSWNYRGEDGGGVILDMFPHWRYVLDRIVAPVRSVYAHAATHVPRRHDENGRPYRATADDAAYGVFELEGGVVAQINSSWTVRVDRDELVEFQIDGTEGSAVAGLRECRIQHRAATPKAVWNPDLPATEDFRAQWQRVPDNQEFGNAFKAQWELFLTHVATGSPFGWDLLEGAKGVQLAELGLRSWREGRRLDVPELER
ncbi:Gfo/Idh/MocA family protein [Wenjunlia tyrosinilytica]|jgi:predicted dehydrogenase|uniref:Oxidoreductase n=1 Tax=Wenjunlia tyrosinilytica TaxID=1544741 RepID=A0A918DVS9_9ACTN|nr:Gfo/Idh/MocA family oxidoreductase [Wenjunlia tyrosinilytica]GGO83834.1 oxidoreductase [Wenjunlia tyrosinilytica]